MATSFEHVLHLFNSVWFHNQIFQQKCHHKLFSCEDEEEEVPEKSEHGESTKSLKVRSHSDNFLITSGTGLLSDSQSPTSVLPTPRLQTIFSGKDVAGLDKPAIKEGCPNIIAAAPTKPCNSKNVNRQRKKQGRGRAGPGSSKSLTDLEFEELKGFKDLGFVFSEEDREDADLVSIVPGLQRLRRRSDSYDVEEKRLNENVVNVERPYLSEAWSVMEKKGALMRPAALVINHRIRQAGMDNEMAMKEQIKCWAHSVATGRAYFQV